MKPLLFSLIGDFYHIYQKYTKAETTVYAAQASFFIVIAAFPFLMLLLTLLQFIPSVGQSDLLNLLIRITPETIHSIVVSVVNDLYIRSPKTVLSITAVSALWSASIGIMSIERGLNRIYSCENPRNYVIRRLICTIYTVIFIFSCIAALVILVLGNSIRQTVVHFLPFLAHAAKHIMWISSRFSFVLLFLCFIGIYTVLPWKKQNPFHQIPGALLAVIGWCIFSYLFSLYFQYFNTYSYMYGSLTAIVLLMLWLYFCICILFLGAVINHHIWNTSGE